MTKYILDSYAWIEYFSGTKKGEIVREIIEDKGNEVYTSSLAFAEITIKLLKSGKDPAEAHMFLTLSSKELPVDTEVAKEAAYLYVEKRKKFKDIGIVDVIIMTQARRNGLTILTGDDEYFKGEKNTILLKD
jgi:predicted nucleic acid-binding protein